MTNKIKMSRAEWEAEGIKRFGENKFYWKFKCPVCKCVMSASNYKAAGAKEKDVAFNCIGRFLPKEESQRALGGDKRKTGVPCDYSGGGLFQLNPIELDDGSAWFEFADSEE